MDDKNGDKKDSRQGDTSGSGQDSKVRVLREHGALHPRPHRVGDPLFQGSEFFDPRDLALVKYEMIRRVAEGTWRGHPCQGQ